MITHHGNPRRPAILDDTIRDDPAAVKLIKFRVWRNLKGVGVDLLGYPKQAEGTSEQQVVEHEALEEGEPGDEELPDADARRSVPFPVDCEV